MEDDLIQYDHLVANNNLLWNYLINLKSNYDGKIDKLINRFLLNYPSLIVATIDENSFYIYLESHKVEFYTDYV